MKTCATVALVLLLWAVGAAAHPGRLDKDGCHHVRKAFVYRSGKVAPKGEYHCHRLAQGQPARLDGREVLMGSKAELEREPEADEEREDQGEAP